MRSHTTSLWLTFLAGVGAMLATLAAAADDKPVSSDPAAGELLVASAAIKDPRFFHSVILIVRHTPDGAFGIAINKLLGERPLAALLADGTGKEKDAGDKDMKDGAAAGTIRVLLGGPVEPQLGFIVHTAEYHRAETIAVTGGLAMTATKEVLRDIGARRGPKKYLFALGYSGWGSAQLEGEIARHDWFTEPAAPDLVFDADRDTVWEKAIARRTREL